MTQEWKAVERRGCWEVTTKDEKYSACICPTRSLARRIAKLLTEHGATEKPLTLEFVRSLDWWPDK